jgi:hypothetical protein
VGGHDTRSSFRRDPQKRFLDYPGKFVYHGHILEHEDWGMMGIGKVIE